MTPPWLLRMRWLNLLFAHWTVDPEQVRRLLPPTLELDLRDGAAWLGVVPFTMTDVAPRGVPAIPRFSTFPEINVRTYVRHRGLPGVWFISLDAASRPTVLGGRSMFHLAFYHADMAARQHGEATDYRSRRPDGVRPASFVARYRPTDPIEAAIPGSLEAFLTDRKRLFSADRRGRIWRTE